MRITSTVIKIASSVSLEVGYSAIQGLYKLDVNGSTRLNGATQINSYEIINGVANGTSTYLQFNNNGSTIGYIGSAAAITGGSSTSLAFGNSSGLGLVIKSTTGAATFSSSVTATSFFESSSIKGKDIIKTNPLTNLNLDVIQYTRKTDENKDIRYGYSAEQIHSLMPELTDKDVTAVKYLDVHTLLIAQLQQEIKELKAKLN
jgi:hypothetical protein